MWQLVFGMEWNNTMSIWSLWICLELELRLSPYIFSGTWMMYAHHRYFAWWRHEMETFSALLALCAGNSPVTGEFPAQMPVTRSFDVFFDLRLNKRLSKQSWGWWFETLSHPLWRHNNDTKDAYLHAGWCLSAWQCQPTCRHNNNQQGPDSV